MSGVDTVRGIGYQQAHGVLEALAMLEDPLFGSIRVEGTDDIVDVEVFFKDGRLYRAAQFKVRADRYTWGQAELLEVFTRWAALPDAQHATFEFRTDGRLGTTGVLVEQALQSSAAGDSTDLVALLGSQASDADVLDALSRARIQQDPPGISVGTLLLQAERQVAAMLPAVRSRQELREQAAGAVDRLFRYMFVATSQTDPDERLLTRQDIARELGVPEDQTAAQRWPGAVRDRYLTAVTSTAQDTLVDLRLRPASSSSLPGDQAQVGLAEDVSALRLGGTPVILAGRSGSGKSTAVSRLRRQSAEAGSPVIAAHAESYLPGRLAALVADSLGTVLEQDLPSATGVQALADPDVTLVIDGVSEVSQSLRDALAEELRAPVSAGQGARVVLVGRDVAAISAVLPISSSPLSYEMVPLSRPQKMELAEHAAAGNSARARAAMAAVTEVLGEAADNPMLFTMGLEVVDVLPGLTGRAALYRSFLSRLAQRTGTADLGVAAPALGIIFAKLLDSGRRFADIFEWRQLLTEAAGALSAAGLPTTADALDASARRSGLISLAGWDQTVMPVHDSFADYLAGAAHARGSAALPQHLAPADEQRVLFSAEIGGVTGAVARAVARDLPFTAVALAQHDRRPLGDDAPEETAALLGLLSAGAGGVLLARVDGGRVMALQAGASASGWIDQSKAVRLSRSSFPAAVLDASAGPLPIAVRLWRRHLLELLKAPPGTRPDRPGTQAVAVQLLEDHARLTAAATETLIASVAPPGHQAVLAARVGPVGLNAVIDVAPAGPVGVDDWHVQYLRGSQITVAPSGQEATPLDPTASGSGILSGFLDHSPEQTAAERVRTAIGSLTSSNWLTR